MRPAHPYLGYLERRLGGGGAATDLPTIAARQMLNLPNGLPGAGTASDVDDLLRQFCARKRIIVTAGFSAAGRAARLYTRDGGYTVKVRQSVARQSFRFLLAHECAHTLAYDETGSRPRRLLPNSSLEERVCDQIARAVLLPVAPMHREGDELTAVNVLRDAVSGAQRWNVVLWQVVRALIEHAESSELVAVLWTLSEVPLFANEARIVDVCAPRGVFVPIGDRVMHATDNGRLLWQATPYNVVSGVERFGSGSLNGHFESALVASQTSRFVTQVLRLDGAHVAKLRGWRQRHPSSADRD